ncbi:MAG: SDR family oxidoreductase [Candidatus Latescibacteria bacterium]|nr:SDR family oxidoreductase [Candidatus Latescibacterota bacterium]
MPIDLSGRVALVTGGTSQLGRVMVRTLAAAGADLAIHYKQNQQGAAGLCAEVEALGRRALAVQAEVADLPAVLAMRDTIRQSLGDPGIVVTNAVSQVAWNTVLETDPATYEDQFRTCVLQNVHLAKAFVPAMIARGQGRFIGINPECTMQLKPNQSAYASAKRGMDGVLRVLAREVGEHQITINQVAPGWTISDRDREQGTERHEAYEATVPLRRRGTDQEIANVVAFLASDLASFITGAYVPVCGGNVMPTI